MANKRQAAGFASGLLDLMGIQNFGQGFSEVNGELQVTVDATSHLGVSKQVLKTGSNAAAAVGSTLLLTVPQGKIWRLLAGSVNTSGAVGITASRVAMLLAPSSNLLGLVFLSDQVNGAAAELCESPLRFPGLIVAPGSQFYIWIGNLAGGANVPCQLNLLVEELSSGA